MRLEDAGVLLTGATGGIGRALARLFHAAGARLLLTARDASAVDALAAELRAGAAGQSLRDAASSSRSGASAFRGAPSQAHTAPVTTVAADLLNRDGVAVVGAAAARFPGGIDVLVNNAGCNDSRLFGELDADELETIVALDLLVPMRLSRSLLPMLVARPCAAIVNIGSVFGSIGYPGNVAYSASKFGLRGFSEALRRELSDTSVRVCYVAPRVVATAFNSARVSAMNRALGNREDTPETVGAAVVRAIESEAAITVIGQPERFFTRVNALLPRLVDGAIRRQLPLIKRHLRA